MSQTVVALYDDFVTARRVVEDLVEAGFSRTDISMIANDASGEYAGYLDEDVTPEEGAGFGAVVGALVGLGVALIPGVGPVLAAGPFAAAAMAGIGAVAGAATGGITAALMDLGIPEGEAGYYLEGIRRGGTLVTMTVTDESVNRAQDIMNRHNPVDLERRSGIWRIAGWAGYDASAQPLTRDQIAAERSSYTPTSTSKPTYGSVEPMGDMGYRTYESFEPGWHTHYNANFANSGYTYDQYVPAYRYGYNLATNQNYRGWDWDRLEPEAHRYWEDRNPNTWEQFKSAIRQAWWDVRDALNV